ncbi:uncharacterized protein LOC124556664 [Schistocerca americana]|uniref:uncharacterized protein LOC124556664 n=1 Tax=Schistocerca americana TaxID=7009 RepID=UPI001F4FE96B|nr:uncharacterized protein LOC124556664 [Schistocerca americana]
MFVKVFALVLISALLVTSQDVETESEEGEPAKNKISKEVILQKINEEKRFLIDNFEHVRAMTESFVEQMKESVQVSLLKELNQLLYKTQELAEDTLIEAEDAGVLAYECVTKLEEKARALSPDGVERMRLCVEDEAQEGFRLREDVRVAVDTVAPLLLNLQRKLLDCIEESEKSDPSMSEMEHITKCVKSEDVTSASKEKEVADKKLEKQLQRAREKQKRGNRCLADVMDQMRLEYDAVRQEIRACAQPAPKEEL